MDQFRSDGLSALQTSLTATTGLPTTAISTPCISSGSDLSTFLSGGSVFNACVAAINAIPLLATDQVMFLWDQGEGNANDSVADVPDYYGPTIAKLHSDEAAAIGRTTANAPWISGGKGTASFGGATSTTQQSWTVMTNGIKVGLNYDSHMYWFTQYSLVRGDGYHYHTSADGTEKEVPWFARYITTLMGFTTGFPTFPIASAVAASGTTTTVNVTQNLGTDWTPTTGTTGTNGFEVSGDNGATWVQASHAHASATQITLTHASLTTNNARLVRYLYGYAPPNVVSNCDSPGPPSPPCTPPTNMIFDNSANPVPLSPTTLYPLRTTGGATLPMPTWRDVGSFTQGACSTTCVETTSGLQLGPEAVQKFLILTIQNIDLSFSTISSWTIQPQDYNGNNVGSPVSPSTTPIQRIGKTAILSAALNANNAGATTFSITMTLSQNPFGNPLIQCWTVPLADMNSTTPTGSNTGTASSTAATSGTFAVSTGGFVIAASENSASPTSLAAALTGTDPNSYANRWQVSDSQFGGDVANATANASATTTVTYPNTGTVNLAAVAWR